MSAAFTAFMEQYHKTGSEKADGYGRNAFIGLEPDEAEEVFRLLTSELPWSAEWLVLVDLQRAVTVMKQMEPGLRGRSYSGAYMLQQLLANQDGELIYQQHMIDDYPSCDDDVKPAVILAISRTPVTQAALDFFREVILVDANETAVFRAGWGLLSALNYPRRDAAEQANYRRLLNDLRSDNEHTKLLAFEEIDRFVNG